MENQNLTHEEKLSPALWDLYNFIKHRTLSKEKTTVKDICDFMPNVYKLNAKESNFSNCPNLYKDIDILNASYEIEKIIVKDNNNFRLATKEEAEIYEQKLKIRALKLLKKYWIVNNKIAVDGNGKLISCQGQPIVDKSKAREFIESFVSEAEKN